MNMNNTLKRILGWFQTDTVRSIYINKWFYLSVLISAYVISKCSKKMFVVSFLTFVGVSMLGYITHAASHLPEVIQLYNMAYNRLSSNTTSPFLKNIIDKGYWFVSNV